VRGAGGATRFRGQRKNERSSSTIRVILWGKLKESRKKTEEGGGKKKRFIGSSMWETQTGFAGRWEKSKKGRRGDDERFRISLKRETGGLGLGKGLRKCSNGARSPWKMGDRSEGRSDHVECNTKSGSESYANGINELHGSSVGKLGEENMTKPKIYSKQSPAGSEIKWKKRRASL